MNVKCLHLLLCGMLSVGFMGCDAPPNAQKRAAETLVFNVDATRLEPAITDTMLNITMAAPKEWKKIDDAVLAQAMEQVAPRLEQGLKLVPRWIFMNVRSRAMCIVSRVKRRRDCAGRHLIRGAGERLPRCLSRGDGEAGNF